MENNVYDYLAYVHTYASACIKYPSVFQTDLFESSLLTNEDDDVHTIHTIDPNTIRDVSTHVVQTKAVRFQFTNRMGMPVAIFRPKAFHPYHATSSQSLLPAYMKS